MSKTQLLEEAGRVGLVVHHKWTVEEIKAAIQEHRMNDPNAHPSHKMKVGHPAEHARAQVEGGRARNRVSFQCDEREPVAAYPRQLCDPSDGVDEDRQVQGLGVWRDSEPVRHVGSTGSADERKPARGAGEVREMVGVGATPGTTMARPSRRNSVVPYPLSCQGEASASSAWSEVDNTQSPIVPRTGSARAGYNKDLPPWSDYQSPTKMNKRTIGQLWLRQGRDERDGVRGGSQGAGEEIRALESKLAALKDKAKVTGATPPKK